MKTFDRNDPELWEILPDWINKIIQSETGRWFSCEPGKYYTMITININPVENWKDSLTERPR
jgi:hypothetical protein